MHTKPRDRTPREQQRINIVLDYIKAYPEQWDQTTWRTHDAFPVVNDRGETHTCGTAYCFAGYAQYFFDASSDGPFVSWVTENIAAAMYGFSRTETDYYFNSGRTLEELETARWPWYGHDGFGQDGYDRNGYDPDGFGQSGYDAQGYDMQGTDAFGDPRPSARVADTLDVQPPSPMLTPLSALDLDNVTQQIAEQRDRFPIPSPHVVVVGNPRDGIKVVGPFADNDAALRYMERGMDDACYEIQLTPPKE